MAYTSRNFKSKKELKTAVQNGERVTMQAGMFGPVADGESTVEGPHYPQPHRWYARVQVQNGKVVKVLS